jgi:hypothetical protein
MKPRRSRSGANPGVLSTTAKKALPGNENKRAETKDGGDGQGQPAGVGQARVETGVEPIIVRSVPPPADFRSK